MCYIRPLKVKRIEGKIVYLEKGIKAFYDKKTCLPAGRVGVIKPNDSVLVFGNLILQKINEKSN